MDVIHFTRGATDPLKSAGSQGAHFLPLADGEGQDHIGCLHLEPGATVTAPSLDLSVALLVVHGRVTIIVDAPFVKLQVYAGMGCVFDKQERYSLESEIGAIIIIVESHLLKAHVRGISSPQRIAGQIWPGDPVVGN